MSHPSMSKNIRRQLERLAASYGNMAFFVDFDGTMVDLVPDPDQVVVPTVLVRDLKVISAAHDCAFAIVSGRPLTQLDRFLPDVSLPAIGSHGTEIRAEQGTSIQLLALPIPAALRKAIRNISDRHSSIFEDKIQSLSFHLPFSRIADDLEPEISDALGKNKAEYVIRKTGRTYEILQKHFNKGTGIKALMSKNHFMGKTPVYIGDAVHSDDSLDVVSHMGGTLIAVRHMHDTATKQLPEEVLPDSAHVRFLLSALAECAQQ